MQPNSQKIVIEDEEIGTAHYHESKCQTALLSTREQQDGSEGQVTHHTNGAKMVPVLLPATWEALLDEFQGTHTHHQLIDVLLAEVRDVEAPVSAPGVPLWTELICQ